MSAQLTCREHSGAVLVEDYHAGDMTCMKFELVVDDRVTDVESEWRTFSNEKDNKDNSHVGAAENPLFDGADMPTVIATGSASGSMKDEIGKAMYKNRCSVNRRNRTLIRGYKEIAQMEDRLNLPKMLVDRVSMLFKKVHDSRAVKGYSYRTVASACVYIACRQDGFPRTLKEIHAISNVRLKEIGRVFKLLLKILETSVDIITSGDFMSRFCSDLGLAPVIQKAATHIAERAVEMNLLPGRMPTTVAATAIYMASQASDDKKTAKEIGDIAGVAKTTISKSYKSLLPKAMELFPADFKFSTPVEKLPTR